MWLRSDKRELRNRNQPKTKFLNHRKKRKRTNQYCKTIKLMKNEKKLVASQYSQDDLSLYNDKALKAKKHKVNKKIFTNKNIESLSFSSDSVSHQFGTISYDLNNIDIDLNIRTSSLDSAENEVLVDYGSTSEHFQPLNTQYDFDCNYSKTPTEITVSDILLKSKLNK